MFRHLQETRQEYWDHFWFAFTSAVKLQIASWASVVHAVIPDLVPFVAEKMTKDLAEKSQVRQQRRKI